MRRQGAAAIYFGIALAAAGFGVIGLAWEGAASLDYVQGQFPYLLSGGLAGLGLIIVGTTVMVVQVLRRESARRAADLERLTAAVAALHAALSPADPFDPGVSGEYRPRPRRGEQPPAPVAVSSGRQRPT